MEPAYPSGGLRRRSSRRGWRSATARRRRWRGGGLRRSWSTSPPPTRRGRTRARHHAPGPRPSRGRRWRAGLGLDGRGVENAAGPWATLGSQDGWTLDPSSARTFASAGVVTPATWVVSGSTRGGDTEASEVTPAPRWGRIRPRPPMVHEGPGRPRPGRPSGPRPGR